jgi:hypothetical protein
MERNETASVVPFLYLMAGAAPFRQTKPLPAAYSTVPASQRQCFFAFLFFGSS